MTLARSHPRSWFRRVGADYDDYKSVSDDQDDLGAEYVPGAKAWVELKHEVIDIADGLGVGPEVSALFEAFKVSTTLGFHAAASGAAGAAALGITAGISAGVVGGVVVALAAIFGGGDDEETAAKKRRDKIRASCWRVLSKPTIQSLAKEQDDEAKNAQILSDITHFSDPAASASATAARSAAQKLASFYRLAADTLSPSELALFLAGVWVARLIALRDSVAALKNQQGSYQDTHVGFLTLYQTVQLAMPELDEELGKRIPMAIAEFEALAKKKTFPKKALSLLPSAAAAGSALLALGVGAASLYYFKPALAKSLASKGASLAKSGASSAITAGSSAVRYVKGKVE